jgi:hypothetical protein
MQQSMVELVHIHTRWNRCKGRGFNGPSRFSPRKITVSLLRDKDVLTMSML